MSITSRAAGIVLRNTRDRSRRMRLTGTGRCGGMSETRVQDLPPFTGHSPDKDRPLGWYAVLISLFSGLAGGFATWFRRSGRELPERMETRDVALIALATHKGSRMLGKARVTAPVRAPFTRYEGNAGPSEVSERARGRGLRRVIGELITCPYCLSMWIAAAFTAGLLVAPRPTRWVASLLTAVFGSDVLQIAYRKAEDTL
jgi:uncharacterized protein DUF1360